MLPIAIRLASNDGTIKYVWRLGDNNTIESVYLRFPKHDSLCISSQAGCNLRCAFCATGLDGLVRNLTSDEIVAQVESLFEDQGPPGRAFEVSFMGMGEPLLNMESVIGAIETLRSHYPNMLFSLSTVGLVPQIYALSTRDLKIQLQISLHAPDDKLRSQIMPINTKYPIAEVLEAAKHYASVTHTNFYVNYLLLDGVNDSDECAHALVALLTGLPAYTRVAMYNSITEIDLQPASQARHEAFGRICAEGGLNMYQFNSLGVDIASGCGQLRSNVVRGSQLLPRLRRGAH